MPERIQLRRKKGWKMPDNTVKVDRSTPWGNPFVVGKHGDRAECIRLHMLLLAGKVCLTTENYNEQIKHAEYVKEHIHELIDKNLACWCPLNKPCHADNLLLAAKQKSQT